MTTNAEQLLKSTVDEILRIEEEIGVLRSDAKEFYASLKDAGFDTTVVRKMVTRMKRERQDVIEQDQLLYQMENQMGLELPDW